MSSTEQIIPSSDQSQSTSIWRDVSLDSQWRIYRYFLMSSDICATILAFWSAYVIRFQSGLPIFEEDAFDAPAFYFRVILILLPVWGIIFHSLGLYDRKNLLGGTQEYSLVFRATLIGFLVIIIAGFLEPVFIIARGWLLLAWMLAFLFAAGGRFILRRIAYALRRRGHFLSTAIIVGANEEGRSLAEQLTEWQTSGLRIIGFVDDDLEPGVGVYNHFRALGSIDQLESIVKQNNIQEIILATSALTRKEMIDIFKEYGVTENVNLRLSSGLFELITTGLTVKEFAFAPLVGVNKVRLTGIDKVLKTLMDYILTIFCLIFFSPVILILAIAVKFDSPGPIFHRRRVMGVSGKEFDAYKFRTMYTSGDKILEDYPELRSRLELDHKLKDDPRVTRMGKFLRKFSLDELPQLFNVIKNEMSLVGPRMISPAELPKYNQWGINLLTVHPGITGLWQVSGRSDVSYEERVRLDMYYIRNWTIWLDLQLLIRTIPAVLKQKGAY